jgi:hypothetical protein
VLPGPLPRENSDHFESRLRVGSQSVSLRARLHSGQRPWGVSDPADSSWGRTSDAEAGSLTPLPCCDICTRALSGRHNTPPDADDGDRPKAVLSKQLQSARLSWVADRTMGTRPRRRDTRGPTAPWAMFPLLGPQSLVRLRADLKETMTGVDSLTPARMRRRHVVRARTRSRACWKNLGSSVCLLTSQST